MVIIDLYIVRHGQTDANVAGVNGGPDVSLNATGVNQAKRLFDSKRLPQDPSIIYSSPHARAVQTAKLATGKEPTNCPLIQERSFGKWEGARWDEIFKRTKGLN